jgi:hypothetical protein
MGFFHKKMSQNLWATIMPFGPVTNILLAPKKIFWASLRLAIISSIGFYIPNSVIRGTFDPHTEPLLDCFAGLPMGENPGGRKPIKNQIITRSNI